MPDLKKEEVDRLINEYEKRNGNSIKDFSIKEIVLMFHKDTKEGLDRCYKEAMKSQKILDKHLEWSITNKEEGYALLNSIQEKNIKILSDHDKLMQHILEVLPEKGFCEKVSNTLWPEKPDVPLDQKVNIIWHDRRWFKYAVIGFVGLLGVDIFTNIWM